MTASRLILVQVIYKDDNGFYMSVERELDDAIITARQLLVEGRDVRLFVDKGYESAYDLLIKNKARVLQ